MNILSESQQSHPCPNCKRENLALNQMGNGKCIYCVNDTEPMKDNKTAEEIIKKAIDELGQSVPKFNGGKCKDSCNCLEIAEWEAGDGMEPGQVKSYPCLGGVDDKIKAMESYVSEGEPIYSKNEVQKLLKEQREICAKIAMEIEGDILLTLPR